MQNPIQEILTNEQFKELTERNYIDKVGLRDYIVRRDYFRLNKTMTRLSALNFLGLQHGLKPMSIEKIIHKNKYTFENLK